MEEDERGIVFEMAPSMIEFINRHLPKGYSLQLASKNLKPRDPRRREVEERPPQEDRPSKRNKAKELRMPKGLDDELRNCYRILQALKKHECAYPFLEPVDYVSLKIPDYPTIVKEPMDLGTVQANFQRGEYSTKNQFLADINKIWLNSYKYNQKGSDIYKMTVDMEKYFIRLCNEEPLPPERHDRPKARPAPKPGKEAPLSIAEKRALGQNIRKLPAKSLMGVWNIVSDEQMGSSELIEFDIDTLPVRKCRELEQYVRNIMQNQQWRTTDTQKPTIPEPDQSSFSVSQS